MRRPSDVFSADWLTQNNNWTNKRSCRLQWKESADSAPLPNATFLISNTKEFGFNFSYGGGGVGGNSASSRRFDSLDEMAPWQPNKTFRRKFVQSQKEFGFVLTCVARVAVSVVDEMEIETAVGRAFSPNLFTIRMAVGPGHPPTWQRRPNGDDDARRYITGDIPRLVERVVGIDWSEETPERSNWFSFLLLFLDGARAYRPQRT